MVKLTRLYKGLADLQEHLELSEFDRNERCLVRIYTSTMWRDEVANMIRGLKLLLPNSSLIGASSSYSIIHNGQAIEDETIVIIETYKNLEFECAAFEWKDKTTADLAKEVHEKFACDDETSDEVVHILFADRFDSAHGFVDEINKLTPMMKLVGGLAGDIYPPLGENIPGFVFTYDGVVDDGAVAFKVFNKTEIEEKHGVFYTNVCEVSEEVSPVYKITKTDGDLIEEIEGEPALKWFFDFLGIHQDVENYSEIDVNNYLAHFPLKFENFDSSARCTMHRGGEDDFAITFYYSKLPVLKEGLEFKVGYVNPDKTIKESRQLANTLLEVPIESIFVYSCLLRHTFLKNSTKWEFMALDDICVSGIYTFGEIGYSNGKNHFNDGVNIFTTIAEEKKYILPKFEKLDLKEIQEDIVFTPKASQLQSDYLPTQRVVSNDLQTDLSGDSSAMRVKNFNDYKNDAASKVFDKVCLIEVQSADATIAFAGHTEYYKGVNDILTDVDRYMREKFGKLLTYYAINYKTFILPGEKDDETNESFIKKMRILHEKFEHTSSELTGLAGITKFVTVVNQNNLVEAGMNILFTSKESEESFILCDTELEADMSTIEEQNCIILLKSAIDRNAIVPFYQGINNNKNMKIEKYEALMRIVGEDGTVYPPAKFMDVARKYKFYRQISRMMIERVFEEFSEKNSEVSFNISTNDLEAEDFKSWIIDKMLNFPDPGRVIVEFVETESYMNVDMLQEFIDQLHAIGARIAIDDFGSGYSTFATVLELRPDFIKIDGSIVSQIEVNENSVIILDTISYLARRMNVECVAEFVENAEIQKILDKNGIEFSQGYYYAKPMSNEQLIALHGRSDF